MAILIFAIILVLIAVAVFAFGSFSFEGDRVNLRWVGVIPLLLAGLVLLLGCHTTIGAKTLGVVTAYGKPTGRELSSGWHWKAPWEKVTKINETIFTDAYGPKTNNALAVRLGDGNSAKVDVAIRWHVNPDAATYIYQNYKSDNPAESLRDAVVDTQLAAVVNQVLSSFNPTANVNPNDPGLSFSPDYTKLAAAVTEAMLQQVKDSNGLPLVILDKVTIAGLQYSDQTEARINAIISQAAKTQQAIQAENTAKAQAAANQILADSLSHDPNVLVSQCLTDLADGKFTAPAGFSCWPGTGSSGVVIPSAK